MSLTHSFPCEPLSTGRYRNCTNLPCRLNSITPESSLPTVSNFLTDLPASTTTKDAKSGIQHLPSKRHREEPPAEPLLSNHGIRLARPRARVTDSMRLAFTVSYSSAAAIHERGHTGPRRHRLVGHKHVPYLCALLPAAP